jgi:hypothetical protein
MPALILLIIVTNACDWALTQDALSLGIAREANPVGQWMLAQGLWQSLALKLAIVGTGCLVLFLFRDRRWVRGATWGLAGVYVGLCAWHVAGRLWCL